MIAIMPKIKEVSNSGAILATEDEWGLVENTMMNKFGFTSGYWDTVFTVDGKEYHGFGYSFSCPRAAELGADRNASICTKFIVKSTTYHII
jgi:hypothetical protein